jgi:hypothetical protein
MGVEKGHKRPHDRGEHLASIRKVKRARTRSGWAWQVRYRDPNRKDRSKTFDTKPKAEAFSVAVEADIDRGEFLDPRLGKKTFGEWAQDWLHARSGDIKPTPSSAMRAS